MYDDKLPAKETHVAKKKPIAGTKYNRMNEN